MAVAQVAALVQVRSLAQELPHAIAWQKKKKKKKKKKSGPFQLQSLLTWIILPFSHDSYSHFAIGRTESQNRGTK